MKERTILILMLSASVVANVVLAHKLKQLNHVFGLRPQQQLKSGATVPPFEAIDLAGKAQRIEYSRVSKPTVLYVFTPPCSWCTRNIDNFKELVTRKGVEYRFIGLSLSEAGLAQYVARNDLKLSIFSGLSAEARTAYRLGGTPQTIVISPEGKVLQNWAGAYTGDQKSQVEAFFHVSLPGLRELPKAEAAKN